ncbi:MAG: 23S rRNA (guanosine(2251)-2'-O)-methyltransferase RlmB [Verrucomicrobiales bacterium]|nr:23S rRNA (guanosine(2251)-2'-O)-methyltransferase RlmB [Verrucomicrobiales bacterium]
MSRNRGRSSRRPSSGARSNTHSEAPTGIARLTEEGLFDLLKQEENPLILILDGVQDPHNLGACLRTADGAGVLAVVVPRHKSAPVTETVVRIACGAASSIPVVGVSNMVRFLQALREDYGVRTVGTADQATEGLYETDLTGPLAIVLGAEEKGMRRLTMENCDALITIPMLGEVPCLNVSNATAVCLYEAVRQRR